MTDKQKEVAAAWVLASIWTVTLVWTMGMVALVLMTGDLCDDHCLR